MFAFQILQERPVEMMAELAHATDGLSKRERCCVGLILRRVSRQIEKKLFFGTSMTHMRLFYYYCQISSENYGCYEHCLKMAKMKFRGCFLVTLQKTSDREHVSDFKRSQHDFPKDGGGSMST